MSAVSQGGAQVPQSRHVIKGTLKLVSLLRSAPAQVTHLPVLPLAPGVQGSVQSPLAPPSLGSGFCPADSTSWALETGRAGN